MATKDDYKYSEPTGRIIKCAYVVHDILGCGFLEVVYQRSLAIEMTAGGIAFSRRAGNAFVLQGYKSGGKAC